MKIAFIGTHGVGKTTLCYDLAGILKKHLPSVDIVKEVARSCPLPINRETNLEAQSWILHTQIAMEIASAAQHHTVICDRSVLDNYAYLVAAAGAHPLLDSLVSYWMTTYDYLFKVPLRYGLEQDGIRDTDLEFQREIDRLVDRLLEEKRLSFYPLPSRNRPSWMAFIRRAMKLPEPAASPPAEEEKPLQLALPINAERGRAGRPE